jgi:hypothetical protein
MATLVDFDALLEVVWVSFAAGVAITAVYSVALYGMARSAEARRHGHQGAAAGFGTLGALAALAFVAGVAIGVKTLIGA